MFEKGYGLLPFAKNMSKHICNNSNKSINNKYSQKLLDYAKPPARDAFKAALKGEIKKKEATGDVIGQKVADKITQNSS